MRKTSKGVDSENEWCLKCFSNNGVTGSNAFFLGENETVLYMARIYDHASQYIESCSAKFKFAEAELTVSEVLNNNPTNGDEVFVLENETGIVKLEVPKDGIYNILTECNHDGSVNLISETGESVAAVNFNGQGSCVLSAGTYFYTAESWMTPAESYTTTITYSEPETIRFDSEISTDSENKQYVRFELEDRAAIRAESVTGYLRLRAFSVENSYYISDYVNILPAGEYFLEYSIYGEESTSVLRKADIPTVEIGGEINAFTDNYNRSFVILNAPETGEYEFYTEYGFTMDGNWISGGYTYVILEKDETVYAEYDNPITVNKFVPEYISVSFNEETSFTTEGKKVKLSFTAEAEDTYIVSLKDEYGNNAWLSMVKMFTDDETVYEIVDAEVESKEVKLNANETIYVDIFGAWGTYSIKVTEKEKPLYVSDDVTVDCSNDTYSNVIREVVFTPAESGYYDFAIMRTGGDFYSYVGIKANGRELGEISGYNGVMSNMVYASPDEPLYIELTKGAGQTAELELMFDKLNTKAVEEFSSFEITDRSSYSLIVPKTGKYRMLAKIPDSDGTFECTYFTPTIKNYEKPYEIIDAAADGDNIAGNTFFVYMYAGAGDEILLKGKVYDNPAQVSVEYVEATAVDTNTAVSTDTPAFYTLNLAEDGECVINDISENGYIYICNNDKWDYCYEGETYFDLEKGPLYIFASPAPGSDEGGLAKFIVSAEVSEPETEILRGDGDGDGEITVSDTISILKYVARITLRP